MLASYVLKEQLIKCLFWNYIAPCLAQATTKVQGICALFVRLPDSRKCSKVSFLENVMQMGSWTSVLCHDVSFIFVISFINDL